jgi:hypothetical protein
MWRGVNNRKHKTGRSWLGSCCCYRWFCPSCCRSCATLCCCTHRSQTRRTSAKGFQRAAGQAQQVAEGAHRCSQRAHVHSSKVEHEGGPFHAELPRHCLRPQLRGMCEGRGKQQPCPKVTMAP